MESTASRKVNDLVSDLTCDDYLKCQKARRALVDIGPAAVPALIKALQQGKQWVRWEAAKALSQIGDPKSIATLVNALTDPQFEIRWLAAEGLIRIGPASIIPVLKALISDPSSSWLQLGAHHVFNDLADSRYHDILQPLIRAIEEENSIQIPFEAKKTLDQVMNMD